MNEYSIESFSGSATVPLEKLMEGTKPVVMGKQ